MLALLERPGDVVLREDLRRRLWPNDTVVEFEHSINAAMKRLRHALGDSAEDPHFIETLPRRGYRWKAPVQWVEPPQASVPPTPAPNQSLIGKRVSHYRLLEVLGGGGMGMVYKAEDLKLGRRVALKFLPEELAGDQVALERFRREARAASVPDHPNICTIYEVGEYESAPFIAMQLLQGRTLSERIESAHHDPIPVDELLSIAIQVTSGLDAAHREGIIHRDIKPANIFLTNRGEVKILDFGLAKLSDVVEHDDAPDGIKREDHPDAPRVDLTRIGATIGTASYMSPEQVRGAVLDARTDLFSFGLVLYEMAAGQRAFPENSLSEVRDAVLHRSPVALCSLKAQAPPELGSIIERALQKDSSSRYESASEMRSDLEQMQKEIAPPPLKRARSQVLVTSIPILFGAALTTVVLIVVAGVWIARRDSIARKELRLRQLTWNSTELPVRKAVISPDGKYLAYTDRNGIHLKILATSETRTVPQPDSIQGSRTDWSVISWFPDGTKFIVQTSPPGEVCLGCEHFNIWVVSLLGGPPRKILDDGAAESISPDGSSIAFTANLGEPGGREIWLMDSIGDHRRKFYETDHNSWMRYARWSPDGNRLAYVLVHEIAGQNSALESRDLKGGPAVPIITNANAVHDFIWLPDGSIIYGMEERDGSGCQLLEAKRRSSHRGTNWSGTQNYAVGRLLSRLDFGNGRREKVGFY